MKWVWLGYNSEASDTIGNTAVINREYQIPAMIWPEFMSDYHEIGPRYYYKFGGTDNSFWLRAWPLEWPTAALPITINSANFSILHSFMDTSLVFNPLRIIKLTGYNVATGAGFDLAPATVLTHDLKWVEVTTGALLVDPLTTVAWDIRNFAGANRKYGIYCNSLDAGTVKFCVRVKLLYATINFDITGKAIYNNIDEENSKINTGDEVLVFSKTRSPCTFSNMFANATLLKYKTPTGATGSITAYAHDENRLIAHIPVGLLTAGRWTFQFEYDQHNVPMPTGVTSFSTYDEPFSIKVY